MEPVRNMSLDRNGPQKKDPVVLTQEDRLALGHMKYAQGVGASIRYANELRAVQQPGRLAPFLRSSNLHEDVLRGNLGAGTGFKSVFGDDEESSGRY